MSKQVPRWFERKQPGASLALVLISMAALIGGAMLAVDAGLMVAGRSRLGAALDSAVLAAAQELPSTTSARTVFNQYFAQNLVTNNVFGSATASVTFGGEMTTAIQAEGQAPVRLQFGPFFGINQVTVHSRARAEQVDPDLMLLLDTSESMCYTSGYVHNACTANGPWEPMHTVQTAGVRLARELGDEAMMGIVYYNTSPAIQVPLKDVSQQLDQIEAGIWALHPSGYTDIGAAIRIAVDHLVASARRNPKVIVIESDGRPNVMNGRYIGNDKQTVFQYVRSQADYAATKRVRILSVYVGNYNSSSTLSYRNLMKYLATATSGKYYQVAGEIALTDLFTEVAHVSTIRLMPAQ
jgi:hypothetical protein